MAPGVCRRVMERRGPAADLMKGSMKVWELKEMLGPLDDYLDVDADGREIDTVKRITKPHPERKDSAGRLVVRIFTLQGGKQ